MGTLGGDISFIGHNCSNVLEEKLFSKMLEDNEHRFSGDTTAILLQVVQRFSQEDILRFLVNDELELEVTKQLLSVYDKIELEDVFHFLSQEEKVASLFGIYKQFGILEKKYGSFMAFHYNAEWAKEEVIDILTGYVDQGVDSVGTHAFRMGPREFTLDKDTEGVGKAGEVIKKTEEEILYCMEHMGGVLAGLHEYLQNPEIPPKDIGLNLGTMLPTEEPEYRDVLFFEEQWKPIIDQAITWKEKGLINFVRIEAAHTINEVIALAKLCGDNIPFECCFVGEHHEEYGVVINDPAHPEGVQLIDAMQLIDEALIEEKGKVRSYGLNCGTHRDNYAKALEKSVEREDVEGLPFRERFSILYPNTKFSIQKTATHGTKYYDYCDKGFDEWFLGVLQKFPFLKKIGLCCGSNPRISGKCKKGVSELQHTFALENQKI